MSIKTEMKGTGGGRWMRRADAKRISRKVRRANGKRECSAQRSECSRG